MSLFSLPQKLTDRVLATMENVDNLLAEAQLLIRDARAELAAIKAIREKLLK